MLALHFYIYLILNFIKPEMDYYAISSFNFIQPV